MFVCLVVCESCLAFTATKYHCSKSAWYFGNCLQTPRSLPWCIWNVWVEVYSRAPFTQDKSVKVKLFSLEFVRMAVPTKVDKSRLNSSKADRTKLSVKKVINLYKKQDSWGHCNVEFPIKKQRFLLMPVTSARMALAPALISSSHSHSLKVAWITVQEVRRHIIVFRQTFVGWLAFGFSFQCCFGWFCDRGVKAS